MKEQTIDGIFAQLEDSIYAIKSDKLTMSADNYFYRGHVNITAIEILREHGNMLKAIKNALIDYKLINNGSKRVIGGE